VFRHIACIVSDLPTPDLLRTMQICMRDHLQKWIFHFMNKHKQLDKYNALWLSMAAYDGLTRKNMIYEEVSQWNGKEIKEMSRYPLAVVTHSRGGRSPAQCHILNRSI